MLRKKWDKEENNVDTIIVKKKNNDFISGQMRNRLVYAKRYLMHKSIHCFFLLLLRLLFKIKINKSDKLLFDNFKKIMFM